MVRRIVLGIMLAALVFGGLPVLRPADAQEGGVEISIIAAAYASEPLEAWAGAYAAQHPEPVITLRVYESDDDVVAHLAEADIVVSQNYDQELPIEFECGTISRVYLLLPGMGARYLASEDCGDYVSPKTPVLIDFLRFVVSPDGQQIAIDLGLLPDSVTLVDQGGVEVTIPQPVRRIASAYGVATYYAYATGAGARLVAASYVGVRGPAAQNSMRRVDPNFDTLFTAVSALNQNEVNVEELASLNPDLVLASARTQWLDTVSELGIPILRFEGESPEMFKQAMLLIGQALGPDAAYRAEMYNTYYDDTLALIRAQVASVEQPKRVYFSGTEPLRTASGDMYQTAMIEAAGADSVSAGLTGYWNDVNLEQVLLWDPDVIFVPTYGGASVEAITESDEWAVLGAVQNGQVYQLPMFISPWDTPLPDSILGIMWMAETLYPDQVDLDCEGQVRTFYTMFYDYAISADEVQGLCG